jgi:hypothetical protein
LGRIILNLREKSWEVRGETSNGIVVITTLEFFPVMKSVRLKGHGYFLRNNSGAVSVPWSFWK